MRPVLDVVSVSSHCTLAAINNAASSISLAAELFDVTGTEADAASVLGVGSAATLGALPATFHELRSMAASSISLATERFDVTGTEASAASAQFLSAWLARCLAMSESRIREPVPRGCVVPGPVLPSL